MYSLCFFLLCVCNYAYNLTNIREGEGRTPSPAAWTTTDHTLRSTKVLLWCHSAKFCGTTAVGVRAELVETSGTTGRSVRSAAIHGLRSTESVRIEGRNRGWSTGFVHEVWFASGATVSTVEIWLIATWAKTSRMGLSVSLELHYYRDLLVLSLPRRADTKWDLFVRCVENCLVLKLSFVLSGVIASF